MSDLLSKIKKKNTNSFLPKLYFLHKPKNSFIKYFIMGF